MLALAKAKVVVLDLTPVIEERYSEQATLIRYNADVEKFVAQWKRNNAAFQKSIQKFRLYN